PVAELKLRQLAWLVPVVFNRRTQHNRGSPHGRPQSQFAEPCAVPVAFANVAKQMFVPLMREGATRADQILAGDERLTDESGVDAARVQRLAIRCTGGLQQLVAGAAFTCLSGDAGG